MTRPVYLDNHATTACAGEVVEAMLPFLSERYGNAGSRSHAYGWEAEAAVDIARERLAELLGSEPGTIVFTSGATESNNLAIDGLCARHAGGHVVVSAVEHPAVRDPARALIARGFEVVEVPVEPDGRLEVGRLADALGDDTVLVSVMAANNEVGTIQPVEEIGELLADHPAVFHCDAAQAVGRIPVDVEAWKVDLLSLSGHKMHAPKGVGALWVRRRRRGGAKAPRLLARQLGGGQEGGLRPGTLNVPGIVGLGAAAALAHEKLPEEGPRIAALRDALEAGLREIEPAMRVNGGGSAAEHRLPGNLSATFPGADADALIRQIQGRVAVSAGSACSSGAAGASRVLLALGLSEDEARATLRFGLSRETSEEDVRVAIGAMRDALAAPARLSGPSSVG